MLIDVLGFYGVVVSAAAEDSFLCNDDAAKGRLFSQAPG
jgi:hypothetical protein